MRALQPGPISPETLPTYAEATGLWVITVYYNPCRYRSRRRNYDRFAHALRRSGIPLLTVECAFGDDAYELPESMEIIRVRSGSLLWQKERLLNLAASWLPKSVTAVAWVDCDILFLNPNWAKDTMAQLETCPIVQLFESCVRLEEGDVLVSEPDRVLSFGSIVPKDSSHFSYKRFDAHGHTGYAWAMRREIFDTVGLYEFATAGTADHFMAHAIYGAYGDCITDALKNDWRQIEHLKRWGAKFQRAVNGMLSATPGEIVHLWHGNHSNRKYMERMWVITKLAYDPQTDIVAAPGKPLEWSETALREKPGLIAYFKEYFESRKEDGENAGLSSAA
jgi:hypothetical protein